MWMRGFDAGVLACDRRYVRSVAVRIGLSVYVSVLTHVVSASITCRSCYTAAHAAVYRLSAAGRIYRLARHLNHTYIHIAGGTETAQPWSGFHNFRVS